VAAVVAAALILASCGQDQAAPTDPLASSAEFRRPGINSLWLLSCTPLAADSATQTIGPSGGTIEVGPHRLIVPPGALVSPVAITAIMPSDTLARVRLSPEGLQFAREAKLEMSYAHCLGAWIPVPRQIVYLDLDLSVLEILESLTNLLARKVSTDLDHFSDYAVAW
jgi:hypothetical protein